ncbi:hypothetical protein [Leptospira bandrabouensis]|uniref:Uncharacterized protein n=1 Tax=Leptospira bandrabouensis TaxID=2484903 RepID=A0A6H3NVW9_9LEPT|nr:hypothetical protein [Leptospira bandrabouensis]MCG6144141.1 hypothetical protein [Leptospira bandrabouensis]MCG6150850.1 hypothetical protein [Leptospira bandrabouensis]MCG6159802.1 hypothetical protein [Leptospira bandrabouensis]MCG6163735.1 hypothetical protein [Leptospira bandrabouensis]MCW7457157.1 hypothetical protein [Leptospira bandrabouensis]
MQYRPETKELISTIQDFLMKELLPKLEGDDLLSYKTLVSWNMLGVIAREIESKEFESDLQRIQNLNLKISDLDTKFKSEDFANLTRKEKYNLLLVWNKEFAKTIRNLTKDKTNSDLKPGGKIWNFAKNQLKENLAISNPRFQT